MKSTFVRRGKMIARRVFGRRRRQGIAAIEVKTGQCFVGKSHEEAYQKASREFPHKRFFFANLSSPDFTFLRYWAF